MKNKREREKIESKNTAGAEVKAEALSQITLLILSIFAFAFMIGVVISPGVEGQDPSIISHIAGGIKNQFTPKIPGKYSTMPIFRSVAIAAAVYVGVKLLGNLFGLDEELTNSLATSAAAGTFVYVIGFTWWFAAGIGIVLFTVIFGDKKYKYAVFECLPWQAPTGGRYCGECNKDDKPCSEYRCRSLGQECELLNPGTDEELCTYVSRTDVKSPGIEPDHGVITDGYEYTDVRIRPPGSSTPGRMRIQKEGGGCIEAFTRITFGIITTHDPRDKPGQHEPVPAQCKIDYNHTDSFEDMGWYMDNSRLFRQNHSQLLRLPKPNVDIQEPEIVSNGEYTLYVRCQKKNGAVTEDEFAVTFCVDPEPDMKAPIIEGTNPLNGAPIHYKLEEIAIDVYINEPAECKWSREDRDYEEMENQMSCINDGEQEINNQLFFVCRTTLTGLVIRIDNQFYFKCKDNPLETDESKRNANVDSYPFVLKGTQPLKITRVGPNGTIKGYAEVVQVFLEVETAMGDNDGVATCKYYSPTLDEIEANAIEFATTHSYLHRQSQNLLEGTYTYNFVCTDAGNNAARNSTTFTVEVDRTEPVVTRVFKDGSMLKIRTNEWAICQYSAENCLFELGGREEEGEGIEMVSSGDGKEHSTDWNTNIIYYIKCKDEGGNQPSTCNIVVRPVDLE